MAPVIFCSPVRSRLLENYFYLYNSFTSKYFLQRTLCRTTLFGSKSFSDSEVPKFVSQLSPSLNTEIGTNSPLANNPSHKLNEKAKSFLDDANVVFGRSQKATYIFYPEIAEYVAKTLTSDPRVKNGFFFEINPGLGILSEALLKNGVKRLRLFEIDPQFYSHLKKICDENPNVVEMVEVDFFRLAKIMFQDTITGFDNGEKFFTGVQQSEWTDDPPLVIFGVVPFPREIVFMRFILVCLAEQMGMFSNGRVQLAFFVSGKEYKNMIVSMNKRLNPVAIFYNLFFDIELLAREPKCFFHPRPTKSSKRMNYDDFHLYLVRLTPKQDLLETFQSSERLTEFFHFVKQHTVQRNICVISALESWIPNCGPRLIKKGFTIFTTFEDFSVDQIRDLFLMFSSWPEYATCQFRTAVHSLNHRGNPRMDDNGFESDEFDDLFPDHHVDDAS